MSLNIFRKKKYITLPPQPASKPNDEHIPQVPDGMWVLCPSCKKTVYKKELTEYKICPLCNGHFRLSAWERIGITADKGTFAEINGDLKTENVLDFPGYEDKINKLEALDITEAVITGLCEIGGNKALLCVMDSRFIMGSMGHVVGERLSRAFEAACEAGLPIIIFTASGGARMQEGIISLMQMAKVSAAVKRHSDKGLLYITALTDPTTGGVTASFAMLGDIILAEPKALIGFAGRRVIEQTMRQKLPEQFQTAEFVLEHGFIDRIVSRNEMKEALTKILSIHGKCNWHSNANKCECTPQTEPNLESNQNTETGEIHPMDSVHIARKVNRPTALKFINSIFTDFMEFSGDRRFSDDGAIAGGIALLNGMPVTVIGTQKGGSIDENIKRNFGQPSPEGYRKALRLMKQAEKFGRPVVTFVNTSGAYCGIGAEERGQGEAIATNLYEMSSLKTPIISIITGEGGSGGALALSVADRVWALKYSAYSILSPEGFATILWKDSTRAREAAEVMKLTSGDLLSLSVIEKIIPEAEGGCQNDFDYTANIMKSELFAELSALMEVASERLIDDRFNRFKRY